jgi:ubiquinone/menaquinone biosynthesis C-methylase UbiE
MPRNMRRTFWFLVGALVGAMLGLRWATRRASLITPPALAPLLLNPIRMAYRSPQRMVAFMGAQPAWHTLDVGCGNGAYTLALARHCAWVDAVDVQGAMIEALQSRLAQAGIRNVRAHVAPATHLPFASETFDGVLMISVLPMLHDAAGALAEARRVLKPAGVLVVGEDVFEPEFAPARDVQHWVECAGFRLIDRDSPVLRYSLKFKKHTVPT